MCVFSSDLEETYLKGFRHLDFEPYVDQRRKIWVKFVLFRETIISTLEAKLTGKLILQTEFVDF